MGTQRASKDVRDNYPILLLLNNHKNQRMIMMMKSQHKLLEDNLQDMINHLKNKEHHNTNKIQIIKLQHHNSHKDMINKDKVNNSMDNSNSNHKDTEELIT